MTIFGPLGDAHPVLKEECSFCRVRFQAKDRVTLVPVRRSISGSDLTIPAVILHARCALADAEFGRGYKFESIRDVPHEEERFIRCAREDGTTKDFTLSEIFAMDREESFEEVMRAPGDFEEEDYT